MKALLSILFFSTYTGIFCQVNLVPNGSFESFSACPQLLADFTVDNWFSPAESTPDYYNTCGISGEAGIPSNGFGFQYAQDANAYAGIVLNAIGGGREYIAVELSETLKANTTYYFEYFVSVGDSPNLTSNNLGILLINDTSNLLVDTNTWGGFNAIRSEIQTVVESGIVGDTSNWLKISGHYLAAGNENYLIIGNFKHDDSTVYGNNGSISIESYYYIDNVSLYELSNSSSLPNVFTPNEDGVNDFVDFSEYAGNRITILDRWGSVVLIMDQQSNYQWFGKDHLNRELSAGVYYYIIKTQVASQTGSIHLIR